MGYEALWLRDIVMPQIGGFYWSTQQLDRLWAVVGRV